MRTLIGVVVLGAIAGLVVHVLYVVQWSGSEVAAVDLAPSGRTEAEPVALGPEMNPLRAVLAIDYETRRERLLDYRVVVDGAAAAGVKTVFEADGDARVNLDEAQQRRRGGLSVNLGRFTVPADGGYDIRATIEPAGTAEIEAVQLLLRANSAAFNPWLIGALSAVIVLGFLVARRRRRVA